MQSFDVVVVGGGPAGSTLARELRDSGLEVVLLDKRDFPRDKTCAGWITPAVVGALGLDLADYAQQNVLQPIHAFEIARMGAPRVVNRHGAAPVSYGIRRFEFDHYLLARCGAALRTGEAVESLRQEKGHWIVNDALRARLLVGAGGHFCPVARALGARPGKGETVVGAQEFEVRMTAEQAAQCTARNDTPQLYFCEDLTGYAWVFRKGDWVNVGIGRENPHALGDHAERFFAALARDGVLPEAVARSKPKGHAYLLYNHSARPLIDEAALLIGDSAGLAYPESGEGIRPAVESAILAAQTIRSIHAHGGAFSAAALAPYARAMEARFGPRRWRTGQTAQPPNALKRTLGGWLLGTHWFTREVVTRRWFLHQHVAPLRV
ncbi:MAG: geranylgeranyl reductase [Betaproteobacteria bacterium SG8_39]|nr:MAG: geranylgeranyl reductase [Betaproteobacteria bacterium SG8_39]